MPETVFVLPVLDIIVLGVVAFSMLACLVALGVVWCRSHCCTRIPDRVRVDTESV